jgi:hypothetical protein
MHVQAKGHAAECGAVVHRRVVDVLPEVDHLVPHHLLRPPGMPRARREPDKVPRLMNGPAPT